MSICTILDLYFEMGSPMLENQVKESQSRMASHHGMMSLLYTHFIPMFYLYF